MIEEKQNFYEFGPFRLDVAEGVLIRHGQPVHLTPKALKLLLVLVRRYNHIVEKDELMRQVWPDTVVEETNLAGNIHALRQILGETNGDEKYIETIPKRGYRFVAKVRRVPGRDGGTVSSSSRTIFNAGQEFGELQSSVALSVAASKKAQRAAPSWLVLKLVTAVIAFCGLSGSVIYFLLWNRPKPVEPSPQITSIAVLPLRNLSGDQAEEYFADGMSDAMINELAKISALRVISRTSMMQYKQASKTMPEIARELNVDAVLEGSVLRSNDRVRVTAQLIRTATDQHLWAESYERDLRDVLTLQREVARGIAAEIRVKLTPQEEAQLTNSRSINPAAHEAYLKGVYYWNRAKNTPKDFEPLHKKSFEYFAEAIKLDPGYAAAYSALAGSYHWLASGGLPEFYPKAKEAALKALELDDTLAPAHAALAYITWGLEWNFVEAEREFKRAEELCRDSDNWGYAMFLSSLGRHEEAIVKFRLAQDLDPLTLPLKINLGWSYIDARQYDQAIVQFRNILELAPDQFEAHRGLGTAYALKGLHEEGIAEIQKAFRISKEESDKASLAWAYATAGRRNHAVKLLKQLKDSSKPELAPHTKLAMIYGALGESDSAIAELEKAYAKRQRLLLWLKVDPRFDGLRADLRFSDLLGRVGLPK